LLSVASVFILILPASAAMLLPNDCFVKHLMIDSSSAASAMALNRPEWLVTPMIAAGHGHTVGLKVNGTVIAVGDNKAEQCDVSDWRDIVQIAAGIGHTVGRKYNGTVVAVGCNDFTYPDFGDVVRYQFGQCDVGSWTDIIQVAAGANSWHTVGLKSDGTVVAVGDNENGQCNVGNWTNIIQVAAGTWHTVGLKSNRTVVATGCNIPYVCDVSDWTNIVQVAAGYYYAVGLMTDGTVVTTHFMLNSQFAKWNLLLPAPLMNWPLIGGIIAAATVVGLAIFLVRRKRRGLTPYS